MTWTYHALESALWFGAGAAAAWRFTTLHFQSSLTEAKASADRYKAWWERDSARMIIAEAQVDLTRQQRIDAGKAAHAPQKALRAATTEALRQCVERRKHIPAGTSAAPKQGGSGRMTPDMPTGRGRGAPPTQAAAPQRQSSRRSCLENRAVQSASAEFSTMKGA